MTYIIEAKDGVVNVDAGEQFLTLSESLLPKLASGSSYVVILYNVTTGETASFEEGEYNPFKKLIINTSTLDPGSWKLGILGIAAPDRVTAQAYWDEARFPNLTPPEGISITKRLSSNDILGYGINPVDFSFDLINTKADYKPPVFKISSTQLADKVLNIDAGEKILKLDISLTDDQSKLDSIYITFRNDATKTEKQLDYSPAPWNGWDRSNFSLLWNFNSAATGTWYPVNIYAKDTTGNTLSYRKDGFDDQYEAKTLLAAGIDINTLTFNVINKNPDTTKPVATISSPQLADKTINVDQGEKSLDLIGTITDSGSGFGYISITWKNTATDQTFYAMLGDSIDTAGRYLSNQSTTWLAPGDWVVDFIIVEDKSENAIIYSSYEFNASIQRQSLLAAGINIDELEFKVINTNSDSSAPLISLTVPELADGILDASIGEKTLTLQGVVSDNKSGLKWLSIEFANIEANTTRHFWLNPDDLDQNGNFRKSIDFSWAANGLWRIGNVHLSDNANNNLNYYPTNDSWSSEKKSKLQGAGLDIDKFTFEVKNSTQDITAPRIFIASLQLSDKIVDVNAGEKQVTFSGNIQDQGSGFDYLGITFQNLADKTTRSLYIRNDSLQADGYFSTTIDFTWASQGQWSVSNLWGSDKAGNRLQYYTNNDSTSWSLTSEVADKKALLNAGLDIEALAFSVINSNSDSAPPVISGLSAPEIADQILDTTAGENQITLQGSISDNKSGFTYLNLTYVNSTTNEQKSLWLSYSDLDQSGKFTKSLGFSGASNGKWSLQNVYLSDAAQNSLSFYLDSYDSVSQKQKLKAAGFDIDKFEFNLVNSSTTPAPTYSLSTSAASLNEGATLTTTATTTNVSSGTTLYYSLSGTGITASDFSAGALTGSGIVGTDGKFSFSHTLANDLSTEGAETLQIKLFSDSARTVQVGSTASVTIADTSTPIVRGNSLYTIVDGPSWTQAEANAVKLGGHLASIQTEEENNILYSTFVKAGSAYWQNNHVFIGGTDKNVEGNWSWSDGRNWEFSNWEKGEPNNSDMTGYIHYGHVITEPGEDYAAIWLDGKGTWIDIRDSYYLEQYPHRTTITGIAETPFIRRGDSAYVIVQGPTWEEAEANAVKLGGHLVTINDAEENEWIVKELKQYFLNGAGFIGFSDRDKEGEWTWSSAEPVDYQNWDSSNPSNSGGLENVGIIQFGNGVWNDIATNYWNWFGAMGDIKGIAEIKLSSNNNPTGTPSITGTSMVGSTIKIDASAIKDADNFTGYTPTYKYAWEIAKDPGMTMMMPVWEPLLSADATDGDQTFTITQDLTGKLIRGVVSYLDGYGTQESVASIGSAPITSSAPPSQILTLTTPSKTSLRSGVNTTSAIAYNVSTGEKSLTSIGASLYFDSSQLSVNTQGDPFQKGLLGNAITADTNNADGDLKTDKILSLNYADFGGDFPGAGTTLPLTLANLNLVPTSAYTGTTLHLKGSPAVGYTATGADLTLGYNAAPVVNSTLPALTTNRGRAFSYTFRSDLFTDSDSTLTLSATATSASGSLPSWLTFNPTTRTLSGTPTSGGTLNLNLTASDELGSVSTPLTLKVREVQSLSSSTAPIRYQRNKDVTVPIQYSTTDGSSSTGLAFKVHFNSSLFSFDPTTGVSNKAQADLFQVGAVQLDTADTDNDPTTDRYIPVNIASFSGQFPSAAALSKLADLTFRAADKAIDPLTGLKDTSINFSETEAAQGYGFAGTSATLKPLKFSLDVDGDGKVTALGDGLMVIRHLFGAAFTGEALINKAISPDSPLLGGIAYTSMTPQQKAGVAAQVAANIQQGIDSGLLDVDKDGKTTALGDGLMVIRRLFGAAFEGPALTSKAISPESPYFGPPADYVSVAANIDALKPTISTPVI